MAGTLNIQTGRAGGVYGLKELQQNIQRVLDVSVSHAVINMTADVAGGVLEEARTRARSVGVPHKALDDFFINSKRVSGRSVLGSTADVDVLVGLRKRGTRVRSHGYVEWSASRQVGKFEKTSRLKKKRARLVMSGTKIGENLATMWELGTTKMAARPWWRPTIVSVRPHVLSDLAAGYKRIIEGAV